MLKLICIYRLSSPTERWPARRRQHKKYGEISVLKLF